MFGLQHECAVPLVMAVISMILIATIRVCIEESQGA